MRKGVKRMMALLLAALLAIGSLPAMSLAVVGELPCIVYIDDDGLGSIGYTEATSDPAGGWTLSVDEAGGAVLTLSGFDGSYIESTGDLTIVLDGTNTVTKPADALYGILVNNNLTIRAKNATALDRLTVTCDNNTATNDPALICVNQGSSDTEMRIESGTVTLHGANSDPADVSSYLSGIQMRSTYLYVQNDAVLSVTAPSDAIRHGRVSAETSGDVTLEAGKVIAMRFVASGSGTVTLEGTNPAAYAVAAYDTTFQVASTAGDIIVKNAAVNQLALGSGKAVVDSGENYINYYNGRFDQLNSCNGYYLKDADSNYITNLKIVDKEDIPFAWMVPGSFFAPAELTVGVQYSPQYFYLNKAIRCDITAGESIHYAIDPNTPLTEGITFNEEYTCFGGTPSQESEARTINVIAQRYTGTYNTPTYNPVGEPATLAVPFPAVVRPPKLITVNGETFEENTPSRSGTGWSWAYDGETQVGALTLSGFDGSYIGSTGDLTIVLDGANTLTKPADALNGILVNNNLTIRAKNSTALDSLTVTGLDNTNSDIWTALINAASYNNYGVGDDKMIIESGTITIQGAGEPLHGILMENRSNAVYVQNDAVLSVEVPNSAVNGSLYTQTSGAVNLQSEREAITWRLYASGSGTVTMIGSGAEPAAASYDAFTVESTAGPVIVNNAAIGGLSLSAGKAVVSNDAYGDLLNYYNGYSRTVSGISARYVVDAAKEPVTDMKIVSDALIPFGWMVPGSFFAPAQLKVGTAYSPTYFYLNKAIRWNRTEGVYVRYSIDPYTPLPDGITAVTDEGSNASIYFTGTPTAESEARTINVIAQQYNGSGNIGSPVVLEVPFPATTVDRPVTGIALGQESLTLAIGASETISYTITPNDATIQTVSWHSTDDMIATMDDANGNTGTLVAYKAGKVTITATTTQGSQTDTCIVYVKEATPNPSYMAGSLTGLVPNANYTIAAGAMGATPYAADAAGTIPIDSAWFGKTLTIVKTNAEANCNSNPAYIKLITATFDGNGSVDAPPTKTLIVNGAVTMPLCTMTPPAGKYFAGWGEGSVSGTRHNPNASVNGLTDNTTFYAVWENLTYITAFDATVSAPVAEATPGGPADNTPNATWSSYTWYKGATGENTDFTHFEAGNTYRLRITFGTNTGYAVGGSPTITLNGTVPGTLISQSGNSITYECTFTIPGLLLGVEVSGEVTSNGDANEGAIVQLIQGETVVDSVTAGLDGSYSFSDVAAGEYTLTFDKTNHVTREYTITVGETDVEENAKICLTGDLSGDGKILSNDSTLMLHHIRGTTPLGEYQIECGDLTGDGKVLANDKAILMHHIRGTTLLW